MNNEETILDSRYTSESDNTKKTSVEQPKISEKKKTDWTEKAAYAAGGAVFGAGVTMAGEAVAAPSAKKPEIPEEEKVLEPETVPATSEETTTGVNETNEEVSGVTVEANGTTVHVTGDAKVEIENGNVHIISGQSSEGQQAPEEEVNVTEQHAAHAAPEPEDAIVATATGVRVAHVDDDASFSQAFADARAQVGPGGVFEWHGRVYGTYYKNEWDNMTAEQKHEYQASIDYDDVISHDNMAQHQHDTAHQTGDTHYTSYQEQEQDGNDDVEVRVLEVGLTDLNDDGIPENAAILEINGHEVLIVDIDRDGIADALLCDVDNDGDPEIADISEDNIIMPVQSDVDLYMAQADDAPDYMNDANVGMYEA